MRSQGRGRAARWVAALAAWLMIGAAAPAWAADQAFTITGTTVTDPAGLATDATAGRYWVANGGSGRLTVSALNANGALFGTVHSSDQTTDVEGLAFHGNALFIGDVGGDRSQVMLWRIYGPVPRTVIHQADRYALSYPDGRHRASAIFITNDGRLHVVTRGRTATASGAIYAAPAAAIGTPGSARLQKVGDAPAGVTDATVLADGRVALRTGTDVMTVDASSYRVLQRDRVATQSTGGALTPTIDGTKLLWGPEKVTSPVLAVDVPGGVQATPRASAAPTAEGTSAADAAQSVQRTVASVVSALSEGGNVLALLGAAAVAIVGAVVVLVKR